MVGTIEVRVAEVSCGGRYIFIPANLGSFCTPAAHTEHRYADLPKSRQIITHLKAPIISPISLECWWLYAVTSPAAHLYALRCRRTWDCLITHIYSPELGDQSSLHSTPWCKTLANNFIKMELGGRACNRWLQILEIGLENLGFFTHVNALAFKLGIWPGEVLARENERMKWSREGNQACVPRRQRPLSEESVIRVWKLQKWHISSWKLLISTPIWAALHSMCLHKGWKRIACTCVLIFISPACRN